VSHGDDGYEIDKNIQIIKRREKKEIVKEMCEKRNGAEEGPCGCALPGPNNPKTGRA
jgi:hypothetical protein